MNYDDAQAQTEARADLISTVLDDMESIFAERLAAMPQKFARDPSPGEKPAQGITTPSDINALAVDVLRTMRRGRMLPREPTDEEIARAAPKLWSFDWSARVLRIHAGPVVFALGL